MSESSSLEITRIGRVAQLKMTRTEAANALNAELRLALTQALYDAADSPAVGAVMLTGSTKFFCAGIDLGELAALSNRDLNSGIAAEQNGQSGQNGQNGQAGHDLTAEPQSASETGDDAAADTATEAATNTNSESNNDTWSLLQALEWFPKPLIMHVNGAAVGLGTTMLGFADLAYASLRAKFKCPFTELGVGAEAASTWLLPQLIGWQNAAWMLLSSEWIEPEQAKEYGLIYSYNTHEKSLEDALQAATTLATRNPESVMAIKRTMRAGRTQAIYDAMQLEGEEFMYLIERQMGVAQQQ